MAFSIYCVSEMPLISRRNRHHGFTSKLFEISDHFLLTKWSQQSHSFTTRPLITSHHSSIVTLLFAISVHPVTIYLSNLVYTLPLVLEDSDWPVLSSRTLYQIMLNVRSLYSFESHLRTHLFTVTFFGTAGHQCTHFILLNHFHSDLIFTRNSFSLRYIGFQKLYFIW